MSTKFATLRLLHVLRSPGPGSARRPSSRSQSNDERLGPESTSAAGYRFAVIAARLPAIFGIAGFPALWVSLSLAGLAASISQIALSWTSLELTASPLGVALTMTVRMAPSLLLGIPLGELWDLDALADDCSAARTYDCFFTSAPLNMPNGVASPPNAIAVR